MPLNGSTTSISIIKNVSLHKKALKCLSVRANRVNCAHTPKKLRYEKFSKTTFLSERAPASSGRGAGFAIFQ